MAKQKTKKLPAITTNEQLHSIVDDIARLEVSIRAREAKRDAAVQLVRIEHDKEIEQSKTRLTALMKLAATYANANRPGLFGAAKSAASALAEFGFRSGNPTLKTLNNKHTWESVLEKVKKLGKYFRTVEEVDKQALHDAKLSDAEYAAIGVRVDSGERFFVQSKSDDADRVSLKPDEETD